MPLLWISLAFIAGLVLGKVLPWAVSGWLMLAGGSLLLCILLRRLPARGWFRGPRWLALAEPRLFVPPLLLITALALGAWHMAASGPDLAGGHVAAINDRGAYRLVAVVDAPPDRRDNATLFRLRVEQVAPLKADGSPSGPPHAAHGYLLALIPGRAGWQYGDRLELEGLPVTPPEDEDFRIARTWLARTYTPT